MSAAEHLNKPLFHGTSAFLNQGDIIHPDYDVYGEGESHSTNNAKWASTFGEYTYEVEPLDKPKMVQEHEGVEHWVSRSGYRVKRPLY
jgi:hypothetical protein